MISISLYQRFSRSVSHFISKGHSVSFIWSNCDLIQLIYIPLHDVSTLTENHLTCNLISEHTKTKHIDKNHTKATFKVRAWNKWSSFNRNCCHGVGKIELNMGNNNYYGKFISAKGRIKHEGVHKPISSIHWLLYAFDILSLYRIYVSETNGIHICGAYILCTYIVF